MIADRDRLATTPAHEVALACIEAGIEASTPQHVIGESITVEDDILTIDDGEYDLASYDSVVVLGGGKAADVVARELERTLEGYLDRGLVVSTKAVATETIETAAGSHPIPDQDSLESARRVFQRARSLDEGTLVLAPITGGGSALLALPAGDITLVDLQNTTEELVESGASIREINAVRKHCSAIKGGGLARVAAPATVVGLLFSDVIGDDPGVIASGPTAVDETTYGDALKILDRYDVSVPASVRAHLEAGTDGERAETPADPATLAHVDNHVLADAWTALSAARDAASEAGYEPLVVSSRIRGEATEAALSQLAIAEECAATGTPVEPPAVLLSGGETTVTVTGNGDGGPNLEFALRVAVEQPETVVCASVDTDGEDGGTEVAGAIVDGETLSNPQRGRAALLENDALPVLEESDAVVETGPTGTNVNDLRVFVIEA
jgi:glycerate 2-kinase